MISDFGSFSLTVRETEVVGLVARGLSAKEVALTLDIAPCTVERHVENVRLKTQTRNRVHMIAYLMRNNMLGNYVTMASNAA